MCSLSRNGLLSLLPHPPICQAAGFSRYGFRYLKLCYLDAVGLKICAGFMPYDVRPPYKMCCLDLAMSCADTCRCLRACIYLACHHRKRLMLVFRLAHRVAIEDCTLFHTSLWVLVLPYSSQTATWTPGDWV